MNTDQQCEMTSHKEKPKKKIDTQKKGGQ